MTAFTRRKNKDFALVESVVVAVADTIDLTGLDSDFPHNFLGVQFFSDAAGLVPVTPGAGSGVVTVETINNENVFESIPDSTIDATAPSTVSWDANSKSVRIVPAGITTATHWKAVWTGNRT